MERDKQTELISVYFTPKEKEAIFDYMMKHTYNNSLSKTIREIVLKFLFKK